MIVLKYVTIDVFRSPLNSRFSFLRQFENFIFIFNQDRPNISEARKLTVACKESFSLSQFQHTVQYLYLRGYILGERYTNLFQKHWSPTRSKYLSWICQVGQSFRLCSPMTWRLPPCHLPSVVKDANFSSDGKEEEEKRLYFAPERKEASSFSLRHEKKKKKRENIKVSRLCRVAISFSIAGHKSKLSTNASFASQI